MEQLARSNLDTKLEDQVDETDGRWEPKEQAQLQGVEERTYNW